MACYYAMNELDVPFTQVAVNGVYCEKIGDEVLTSIKATIPKYAQPTGEPRNHQFYTLRVCKRCRAEWMGTIQAWFRATPGGEDGDADEPVAAPSCGSGIYVRRNGINVEITHEEWDRLNPDIEPVVYNPGRD